MVDPYLLVLDSVQLFWPYGITAVSVRQQAQDVAARFLVVFQCQQLALERDEKSGGYILRMLARG